MYIFVRTDLSPAQQAVQSVHAAIEAANHFDFKSLEDHPYVVILSARDERRLHRARRYLIDQGVKHVQFHESDLDDQLTALATEPINGDRRKLFNKYQLLNGGIPEHLRGPIEAKEKEQRAQSDDFRKSQQKAEEERRKEEQRKQDERQLEHLKKLGK